MEKFFTYQLPEERIASRHAGFSGRRDSSKLLHLSWDQREFRILDRTFSAVPEILKAGDLLVLNNTEVIPARFFVSSDHFQESFPRQEMGNDDVEVLLVQRVGESGIREEWEVLARPMKIFKSGHIFPLSKSISAKVLGKTESKRFLRLELRVSESENIRSLEKYIEDEGYTPIPPYIRKGRSDLADRADYQTIFAREKGSVAAPTAGLHFTPEILESVKEKGVDVQFLTLHVGAASFLPIDENSGASERAPLPEKWYASSDVWARIKTTRNERGRVIAVGTTVVRTLETIARSSEPESLLDKWQETSLFIQPGFDFKLVDAMFTNFHQPRSTHLALVSAYIGEAAISEVYKHALENGYRFLSYGDSSFLERKQY